MNHQGTFAIASEADAEKFAGFKPYYTSEDVAERFRWLAEDVDGTWVLLKLDSEIIGWCVVVWSGKTIQIKRPDMQDLYVKEEHRNRGHGSRLIAEIESMAKERGCDRLGLAVNPDDNPAARRLYERLGYRHDGGEKYLDGVYNGFEDWVIDLEKELGHAD
jgi:GNAT superfamily N-acetyltransferase